MPEYQSTVDWVASEIRKAVLTHELVPGDLVLVTKWADRLGTSATPVREAVKLLHAEGILFTEPHKGSRVLFGRRDREEIFQMWRALDPVAIELLFDRCDERQRMELADRLADLNSEFEKALTEADAAMAAEHNLEFHLAIPHASNAHRLGRVLESFWQLSPEVEHPTFTGGEIESLESSVGEHEVLISAIRGGRREEAKQASAEHLARWLARA